MLRIFDAGSGEMLFDLKKHTDWIYTVAYSPDGILIASGGPIGRTGCLGSRHRTHLP